jgi:hypothetical protein
VGVGPRGRELFIAYQSADWRASTARDRNVTLIDCNDYELSGWIFNDYERLPGFACENNIGVVPEYYLTLFKKCK